MPALPKASYETVAQALAAGKTQREAYLAAGYSYRPANAHRLCTSPAIASRVTEIAAQRYEDERKTREIAANEAVHELERYMRCRQCSEVRGHAYKRSHLVALRPNKISASDPPSTWWPGER